MAFENLGDREKQVLASLISHYVSSADPVGSRVIANKFRLGVSPATIRNTMQDLEEMGLVSQPHTSAGRIPTDKGYRLYVDYLLRQEQLTEAEKQAINEIGRSSGGIDTVLEQTSRVLASLSCQLGVGIGPKLDDSVLSRIELVPMAEGKILVVLAFKSGLAQTILLEVDASININKLAEMEQVLNEKLDGLNLGHIRTSVQERLQSTSGDPKLLRLFIDEDSDIWKNLDSEKLHIGGTDNILFQPEFAQRDKLHGLIKLLESRTELINVLRTGGDNESGLVITIGAENKAREIQDCSVVSARYETGQTSGIIGVIGPTRMPYARLVALVQYAARQLTRIFKVND